MFSKRGEKRTTLENEFEEIRKNILRRNFQISLGFIRQDLKENLIKNGKDAGAQIPTELFISNEIIIQLYDNMKDEGQINEFNEIIKYAECY